MLPINFIWTQCGQINVKLLFTVSVSSSKVTRRSSDSPAMHSSIVKSIGSSLNLSCASDTQDEPIWDYYPYTRSQHVTIYSVGKPSEDLDPRFSLDMEGCRANKCSLKIENIQLKDAGCFDCWESHSVSRHLSLTVLGQSCQCTVILIYKIIFSLRVANYFSPGKAEHRMQCNRLSRF